MVWYTFKEFIASVHVCLGKMLKERLKCKTLGKRGFCRNYGILAENVDLLPAASGGVVLVRV